MVERGGRKNELRDLGVSLRCAPGRASRAVGNDTTVANGAEPPARQGPHRTRRFGGARRGLGPPGANPSRIVAKGRNGWMPNMRQTVRLSPPRPAPDVILRPART